jgi:predicted transcriptional regulator
MSGESEASSGRLLEDLPFLSPSEWRIFLLLSSRGPLSVKEIRSELSRSVPDFRQGISTLSTLLQRLMANGYVCRTRSASGPIVYHPVVALEPAFRRHADRFLSDFTQFRREQLECLSGRVREHLEGLGADG